jgi:hypothetical protein
MLISLEDRTRERKLLELWLKEHDADLLLTPGELQELIEHPPKLCFEPGDCVSRYLSGNGCLCIRSSFKNHKQFIQWQQAFEEAVSDKLFKGVLISSKKI